MILTARVIIAVCRRAVFLSNRYYSGADIQLFRENIINAIAADALAACVVGFPRALWLSSKDKWLHVSKDGLL